MKKTVYIGLRSPLLVISIAAFSISGATAQQQAGTPFSIQPSLTIEQPTIETKRELYSEDHTADVVAIDQVWSAYVYYNDASDGTGVASLFTPNGVDQHLWNNYGTLVPSFGVGDVPAIDRFGVNEGTNGAGCVLRGRGQIATYFVRIHNPDYPTITCRSPVETSPASPIEMSRSSVCLRLVEVAWDDGDHDEPQRADPPAGADRCR